MFRKLLILFLSQSLFWSCAIHKDFPYICFLPGCVAKQFGLPGMREVKAKSKSRKKARQWKRLKNKRKNENEKDRMAGKPSAYEEKDSEPGATKKDSLHYSFTTLKEDEYIIIRFITTTGTDSILVKYPEKGNEISDYDKQILKNYLDSNKAGSISAIHIKEHIGSPKEDAHRNKKASPLKQKIADHFIILGIPAEKIRLRTE